MLHVGNALHVLPTLDRGVARTCITSPPYWGLRDYGDPGQEWPAVEFNLALGGVDVPASVPAMTAPLGLEPTPIAYVAHLVAIFRLVREVLTDDGTLWLNIGDTYASDTKGSGGGAGKSTLMMDGREETKRIITADRSNGSARYSPRRIDHGMKSKDLCGIPWLVAYALRSDGWYLRSDVIWHKRNPMPESVTDRPTKGHEYMFLLAKRQRYHCDMGAVREPHSAETMRAIRRGPPSHTDRTPTKGNRPGGQTAQGNLCTGGSNSAHADPAGRNKRTVWSISSQPYPGGHFAPMPPKLIEPCVLAGSEVGDIVLDPLAGSGTVGEVATIHDRRFVGIELSEDYAALARERIGKARVKSGIVTADDAEPGQQLGLLAQL